MKLRTRPLSSRAQTRRPWRAKKGAALVAVAAAVALLSIMDGFVKALSLEMGTYSALFWRGAISLAFATLLLGGHGARKRGLHWPKRPVLMLHLMRGVLITVSSLSFFYATTRMPLAVAIALTFIAPLIALVLAALILKETVGWRAVVGALVGAVGVLVILSMQLGAIGQPGGRAGFDDFLALGAGTLGAGTLGAGAGAGVASALFSALLYAVALITQRSLAQQADPIEVAFLQALVTTLLLLPLIPALGVWPLGNQWLPLTASAGLGVGGVLLFAWGYARAEAKLLVPIEYTAFPWAMLVGWVGFGETIGATTIGGAVLIGGGCWLATRDRSEKPDPPETVSV